MKKVLFSIIFFFIFVIPVSALDTSIKVYDDADLLTDDEEVKLRELALQYVEDHNMDLVIVTTLNNKGKGTQNYAQDFYDYNGFGIGDTYDGILFLIDRTYGYNDAWITTTGHAILVYDDARIDSILDDVSYVKYEGYYAMFETFINSAYSYAEAGVAPSNQDMEIDKDGNYVEKRTFPWVQSLLISFGVSTIVVVIFIFKNKMVKKETRANAYLDEGSINFSRKEDRFITTNTTRTYSPRNTSSSSGGRSGGSSISRGSSGRSHGGGGRRL